MSSDDATRTKCSSQTEKYSADLGRPATSGLTRVVFFPYSTIHHLATGLDGFRGVPDKAVHPHTGSTQTEKWTESKELPSYIHYSIIHLT